MFSQESIAYLKKALREKKVSQAPLDLQILPTTRCNARCFFCPVYAVSEAGKKKFAPRWQAPVRDLNLGILDRLIEDLWRLGGLKRIHITGGEPLLYSHIIPMLFLFRRNFPCAEIALVTNGILLKDYARALAELGLDRISVSVNAGSKESFSRQMKVSEDKFDQLWQGIKALAKFRRNQKPFISLTAVLNQANYQEVEELYSLASDSGADALTFLSLMDFPFPGEPEREFALNQEEFQVFLRELERLQAQAEKSGVYLGFTGTDQHLGKLRSGDIYKRIPCYAGYVFAMVWPDGSVRACCNCEEVLGKLTEQGFYEIWTGERAQRIRERMYQIPRLGAPELCDCEECSYLYENQRYYELLADE